MKKCQEMLKAQESRTPIDLFSENCIMDAGYDLGSGGFGQVKLVELNNKKFA